MNIIIIPHLPTLYGRRYAIAKSFAEQGHEVHFITWEMPYPMTIVGLVPHIFKAWRKSEYSVKKSLVIHKVRRIPFFWPVINGYLFKHQIRSIYERNSIDFVFSQSFTNETEAPLDLPLIYDMNDDHQAFADIYGSRLYKAGYRLLGVKKVIKRQASEAKFVTVVSDSLLNIAKEYNRHVIKLPNGVDIADLKSSAYFKKPRKNSLIYVSTFGRWSGIIEIITIIDSLRLEIPDIHLSLVGDGTELQQARNLVARKGLEKCVTFYGRINDRKKLYRLISEVEVCLNISEKNAFRDAASPIKIFEYSALGKTIVSTNLTEVKKLNLPNIVTYRADKRSTNLRNAILMALSIHRDNSDVVNKIREDYSWDSLTSVVVNTAGNKKTA